jgi:hypothetical protein
MAHSSSNPLLFRDPLINVPAIFPVFLFDCSGPVVVGYLLAMPSRGPTSSSGAAWRCPVLERAAAKTAPVVIYWVHVVFIEQDDKAKHGQRAQNGPVVEYIELTTGGSPRWSRHRAPEYQWHAEITFCQ